MQLENKGSPYSITERRVPEVIPVLCSQPAGDVSHKPGGRLPLLSARPAVTPATLMRAATNFAAFWTEARWVWTVCLRLLPDSVATAIWTRALLRLSPHAYHSPTEPPHAVSRLHFCLCFSVYGRKQRQACNQHLSDGRGIAYTISVLFFICVKCSIFVFP